MIPEDVTLEEVAREKIATYRQFVAQPVDEADPTSPWITGRPRALRAVKKVLGASNYQAREGVNTGGANGVYWLEIIGRRPDRLAVVSNLTEGAKRKTENVQAAIEPDLLYPLLRGRDVGRWQATPSAYILVTHKPGMKLKAIPEDEMAVRLPKTYTYLKRFEDVLWQRKSQSVRRLMEGGAFYSMFAVGSYTFAPYKVVWREVSHCLDAAVAEQQDQPSIEMKCVVPDHTLILIACQEKDEAHFVCAALNSSPSRFVVQNYIVLHPDPHILQRVSVPRYDPTNPIHRQLSALSQQAHQATAAGDTARVQVIEAESDQLAAQLWGLMKEELREIQESLAELK
ncbi:MAG: hypothetical protein HYY20_05280 [Candidatus Tectomicrobia bacterium]|uniref:Uncharacterized protein n=1 Tax=Tectimicrobiota bacterium TaxID=2528274 RepID=A0A932CMU4_UNCTE|nr:hypothetical protein [Candidatus Tectomicrobia bacterium]